MATDDSALLTRHYVDINAGPRFTLETRDAKNRCLFGDEDTQLVVGHAAKAWSVTFNKFCACTVVFLIIAYTHWICINGYSRNKQPPPCQFLTLERE